MSMSLGIQGESPLEVNGSIDVFCRHLALFDQPVSQNCHYTSMEEKHDSIVDAPQTHSKFVNSVTKQIRFWPSKLETKFPQPFDLHPALVLRLGRQLVQPVQHRYDSFLIPVENNIR